VRLSLTRKGDYAIRSMICVGGWDGPGLARARRIAAEMAVPYKYLTQILAELVAKGLLEAKAGPAGGYSLGRPSLEITLLDIVEAAEGPTTFDTCVLEDGPCDWQETCPVHDVWSRAQSSLARELASTTLATLLSIDASIAAGTFKPTTPPHGERAERHGERS
jgi:Rrf2 family transcriptional regulator, iron-sulfur cluster assembly transcription factor